MDFQNSPEVDKIYSSQVSAFIPDNSQKYNSIIMHDLQHFDAVQTAVFIFQRSAMLTLTGSIFIPPQGEHQHELMILLASQGFYLWVQPVSGWIMIKKSTEQFEGHSKIDPQRFVDLS